MKLSQILEIADKVYPDGCIGTNYKVLEDAEGENDVVPVKRRIAGDTLALFIAIEIMETFEEDIPDAEQLRCALYTLGTARKEMQLVTDALLKELEKRRDPEEL